MSKKRYAAVGTGGRLFTFTHNLVDNYADKAELVALCDISQTRMDVHNRRLVEEHGYHAIPTYPADDFEKMLDEQKPDAVIVTTMDAIHHEYIVKCAARGIEAITEKPMTTHLEKCQAILEAMEQTDSKCRVTFNYRYMPDNTKAKELLMEGIIGNVIGVTLNYMLNTNHGADYFRRWHSNMANSGGLLVHKSTHHFDLVNWHIDSIPEQVFAHGRLGFYGRQNALARGDGKLAAYERYTGNATRETDPFAFPLDTDQGMNELYHRAEADSGYLRDRNVFREDIDIYDSMSVTVKYRNGCILTYDLNAFCPREGSRTIFHGDRGQLEVFHFGGSHIIRGQSDEELAAEQERDKGEKGIFVYPHFKPRYEVFPEKAVKGGHGGSDVLLGQRIFDDELPPDPLLRDAGHEQGAASVMVGIAANLSIATGKPVNISDLIKLRPEATKLSELI